MEKLSESADVFKQLFNDDIATSRRENISKVMALSSDKKEITFFLPSFIVITFLQLIYGVSLSRDLSLTDFRIILTLLTLFECTPKVKSRILDCINEESVNIEMWPLLVNNFPESLSTENSLDSDDNSKIENWRKAITEDQEESFPNTILREWDLNFMVNEFLPNLSIYLPSDVVYGTIHDWSKIHFGEVNSPEQLENTGKLNLVRKFIKHLIGMDQAKQKPGIKQVKQKSLYFSIPKAFVTFISKIEDEKIVSPSLVFKIYEIIMKISQDCGKIDYL